MKTNSPLVLSGVFGNQHATLLEFLNRTHQRFSEAAHGKGEEFLKFLNTTRIAWLCDVKPPGLEPGPRDVSQFEVRVN